MEQKKIFRSMWENPFTPIEQDCSNPFQDVYEEIPPYTKGEKGEWLNDTSEPKLIKTGKVNVDEKIQSFAKEVDIYHILEQFAYTEDQSKINRVSGFYADVSKIPTNFNDFEHYVGDKVNDVGQMPKDIAKAVLSDDVSAADVEKKAADILNERVSNLIPKKDKESDN